MNRTNSLSQIAWLNPLQFTFGGRDFRYFFHYHNCGWPPSRCTERTVELALADFWLEHIDHEEVFEIGGVSPYYWPRRVRNVVDPSDPHKLVTFRRSLFDLDLRGRDVLSISTLEHIGTGQYGQMRNPYQAMEALQKILVEARTFLITFPIGYNSALDEVLFTRRILPPDVVLRFMVRLPEGLHWRQESDPSRARLPYGELWANSLAILERGRLLSTGVGRADP